MYEFHIGTKRIHLAALQIEGGIGAATRAAVNLAEGCDPQEKRSSARIVIGGREIHLRVTDCAVPPERRSGGWIQLATSPDLVDPFTLQVFSGKDGASFREVIESCAAVNAPPALARRLPAVVADVPFQNLLGDVCSRQSGWAWWVGANGTVEIGEPGQSKLASDGMVINERPGGFDAQLTGPLVLPGETVEFPNGRTGLVVKVQMNWQQGQVPNTQITTGSAPSCQRFRPTGVTRLPATINQVSPLLVEVADEEDANRKFLSQARLMVRCSDGGQFRESIPLKQGDELLVEVPTGGVSALPPRAYLWRLGELEADYQVKSRTKHEAISEKWSVVAKHMEENVDKKQTRTSRYDIEKR